MCTCSAYFVGIDVGTGSVRAALVTETGKILKSHVENTKTWNVQPDFYEQSTDNIWGAVIKCVKEVTKETDAKNVRGVGFDATCSLACFDKNGNPLTVSPSGVNEQNVILWLDHRAIKETEFINNLNHPVLQYVGGKIFPEMETPKLLWLKKYLKDTWQKAGYFFDLPDFLTWRATDVDSRSSCSLVCKWTYEMNVEGIEAWNKSYFEQVGLEDLAADNWKKIGSVVQYPGSPVGKGLSKRAADELGLLPGTPVGTSMIDAHAGGLGLIGCKADDIDPHFETRVGHLNLYSRHLGFEVKWAEATVKAEWCGKSHARRNCPNILTTTGLICGTSTCHMAVSREAVFTPGVWGPYKSAMIPGMWLNEGGQSATGKLIDHVVDTHPASAEIRKKIGDLHIIQYLNNIIYDLAKKQNLNNPALLTKDFHVYPDFHGNRLLADPTLKGMICGLTLTSDEENLAILYLATVQALSYGTRQIIERLQESGYKNIKSTLICGGLSKNPVFTAAQADVCNLPVICPEETESVLLGSAILGAVAANHFDILEKAIQSMGGTGKVVYPDPESIEFHNKKYKVFLQMYEDQAKYRKIMDV